MFSKEFLRIVSEMAKQMDSVMGPQDLAGLRELQEKQLGEVPATNLIPEVLGSIRQLLIVVYNEGYMQGRRDESAKTK